MINALHDYKILGVKTSKKFMVDVLNHPEFVNGRTYTSFIEEHMAGRAVDLGEFKELAAAVATVAAQTKQAVANGGNGDTTQMPSPWQSLGQWQIGDSING
jgi:acetyl/propionyl-CoA carboxylase alpha subunit